MTIAIPPIWISYASMSQNNKRKANLVSYFLVKIMKFNFWLGIDIIF